MIQISKPVITNPATPQIYKSKPVKLLFDTLNIVSSPSTESVTGYKITKDKTAVTIKPL